MVCGYDTYHDASMKRERSAAALVSSMNKEATRWFSQPAFQGHGAEMVDTLAPLVKSKSLSIVALRSPSSRVALHRRA